MTAYNLDSFDYKTWQVSNTALQLFPHETAKKCKCLPLEVTQTAIHIAVADNFDLQTRDTLTHLTGKQIATHTVPQQALEDALQHFYNQTSEPYAIHEPTTQFQSNDNGAKDIASQLESIINGAIQLNASDIHIEPTEDKLAIRYRVDGKLLPQDSLPLSLHPYLTTHIKLEASLDIDQKRVSQDGRLCWNTQDRAFDLRLSFIPSVHGETVAIRILDHESLNRQLDELGFSQLQEQGFLNLITQPNGLVLVTGPTGSGKTTTLYSAINFLKNQSTRKIITVEDPIEYKIPGVNQVPINTKQGTTFATALRSILRQSPDIIMIGEIRDQETAQIAAQAALTGHLVLSTLHTNDARSTVNRLFELGVKPSLLTPALRGVVAQRLVRRLCKECKASYEPRTNEISWASIPTGNPAQIKFFESSGCDVCRNTGYQNRIGLFELLSFPNNDQYTTLHQDGIRKITSGQTSFNEVAAATLLTT